MSYSSQLSENNSKILKSARDASRILILCVKLLIYNQFYYYPQTM